MSARVHLLIGLSGLLVFGGLLTVRPSESTAAPALPNPGAHTIPNPAAYYCTELGFAYETLQGENGQQGVCRFPDGQTCDAWDFFSGSCGQARNYCASQGYATKVASDGDNSYAPEYAVCVKDGREVAPAAELMQFETELKSQGCESGAQGAGPSAFAQSQQVETLPPVTAQQAADLPAFFDWRDFQGGDWMTPVKDQGGCGSCWAFAAVGAAEAAHNIGYGNPDLDLDLSEEYLVADCSTAGSCCGGWHDQALEFIRVRGIPDEDCMPYVDGHECFCSGDPICAECNYNTYGDCSDLRCSDRCPDWSSRLTTVDTITRISPDVASLEQTLTSIGPLAVTMNMSGYFDGNIFRCDDDSSINHVVVLAGYDNAGEYWIVKNSWGSSWNENGYFYVGFGECAIEQHALLVLENSSQPPEAFGKLSPYEGKSVDTSNLHLTWMNSFGASSYEYCLDTTDNDSCDTEWIDVGNGNDYKLGLLEPSTSYSWQMRAKNNAGITEADEGEWWQFATLDIHTWSDLTVEDITYSPANPVPYQPIELHFLIKNLGTQFTPPFYFDVYIDDPPDGCNDKGDIRSYFYGRSPGEIVDYNFIHPGFAEPGTHQFWAVIDTDCEIDEPDETNNLYGPVSISVQAGPPDLVVQAINWVQDMPGLDQPLTFTVIVKNRGEFPVPAGQMPVLDVYLDYQPQGCGDRSAVISETVIPYAMPAGDIWFHSFMIPGFSQPGEHQVWATIDTDCQVAETDEANNTLGPVEVDVLKYLIFKDGFETGDTSAWSKCHTGSRDLAVTPAAALSGSFGLAARLDNKGPIYCTSKQANAEAQVQARFLLDPNSLRMAQGDSFTVFQALQGGKSVLQIELLRDSNRYRLRASTLDDGKNWRSGRWIFIEDGSQEVEFFWQAATRSDRTNGVLSFWIDGNRRTFISDLDNHTRRIDRVNLGAIAGIDKGTRGTFFLDDFVARRDEYPISP